MKALRHVLRYPVIALAIIILAVVLILLAADIEPAARWTAAVCVFGFMGWTLVRMVRAALHGQVGLDILALLAMGATLAVGEYVASLIIVLMLSGGEALEEFASRRATRELSLLLDRSPRLAHRLGDPSATDGGAIRDVDVETVRVGEVLVVRPGEVVPVDGTLLDESATVDQSSLTGESMPVAKERGAEIASGSVNGERAMRIRALRESRDSEYQQIVALVRRAQASKAPVVRLADRFAIPFTAVSLLIAGAAWFVSRDPVRFAEVLVLATPCPLLIAAPVAFLGGLSRAARAGLIVKGGGVLERMAKLRSAAFDKTGTLTKGRPRIVAVHAEPGFDADTVLRLGASAEQYSTHALADGIRRAALDHGFTLHEATDADEQATNGVLARIAGNEVIIGKPAYVEAHVTGFHRTSLPSGQAAAYLGIGGRFAGSIVLADEERAEARSVISWLRGHGIDRISMLTGDAATTAEGVARAVGIREVHAELHPADKVRLASQQQPRPMLMVGDGINDAPVLAAADVGIAMSAKGATAAGEAADAVIVTDSLTKVVDAVVIGRHTVSVALTAIWIGIGLSLALMIVASTGAIPAVVGALIQEGVDLATILYALRALGGRPVTLAQLDAELDSRKRRSPSEEEQGAYTSLS